MVVRDEIPATGQRVSIPGRHDNANEIVLIMQMDHQHTGRPGSERKGRNEFFKKTGGWEPLLSN
jgi:hypothetical protein